MKNFFTNSHPTKTYPPPPKSLTWNLKNCGWKTILSYWEGNFSGGELLNFRGVSFLLVPFIPKFVETLNLFAELTTFWSLTVLAWSPRVFFERERLRSKWWENWGMAPNNQDISVTFHNFCFVSHRRNVSK